MPTAERAAAAPFVIMDCLYGFACNPCSFSCKQGAITKSSTSTTPKIDYDKCIGCMQCVYQCPGLAIFGYDTRAGKLFLPIEYDAKEGSEVFLVDDNGRKVGEGVIEKILVKPNKTNVARVKVARIYDGGVLTDARGFIVKEKYPEPVEMKPAPAADGKTYICHCEDITVERMLELIEDRKSISADELKHISRMGMGPCRGKRCLSRAKSALRSYGIEVTGDLTPRAPMANLVEFGDVINIPGSEKIILPAGSVTDGGKVGALVAGGGMAGSAVFRYLAEACFAPVLVNKDRGSSWRNIAGGRPAFSLPALADIAAAYRYRFPADTLRQLRPRRGHLQVSRCRQGLVEGLYGGTQGFPEGDIALYESRFESVCCCRSGNGGLLAGHTRQDSKCSPSDRTQPRRPYSGGDRTGGCAQDRRRV